MGDVFTVFQDVSINYLTYPKALSSMLVFIVSFIGIFVYILDYLLERKIANNREYYVTTQFIRTLILITICWFTGVRFVDSLYDFHFILHNPDAVTTLSQQLSFIEVPMFLLAGLLLLQIIVFNIKHVKMIYGVKSKGECDEK